MISYPFESLNTGTAEAPVYDRAITAEQERLFNKLRYTNGVFNVPADGLQVVAAGGMMIAVQAGGCHIEGALGYQAEALSFELTAGGSNPRIDRVVARFNTSISARNIEVVVLEGVPGATPKAPEITRESNYCEIALADIRVNAGATSVGNADITDQRANSDLCGYVVPAIPTPLDLTALYKQYRASLDNFMEFVQTAIDGTTAGNLQNQISELEERVTPISKGGTDADNTAEARQNINFIGSNIITDSNEDTALFWHSQGTGVASFDSDVLIDQPYQIGTLFNMVAGHMVVNLWFCGRDVTTVPVNKKREVYFRIGEYNERLHAWSWWDTWTKLFSETDEIPIKNLGITCDVGLVSSESIAAGAFREIDIAFNKVFSEPPIVSFNLVSSSSDGNAGKCAATYVPGSGTTTGCKIRILNGDTATRAPALEWKAMDRALFT